MLAERLNSCKQRYGAESVVFYKGESLKHQEISNYMSHLAHGFGTPNYMTVGSLCHFAMTLGFKLTCGGMPACDYGRIKTVIAWGANPMVALARSGVALKRAVQNGTKLVVVDPAVSRTAELADCHLALTPGSDGFLALALIQYAILDRQCAPPPAAVGWDEMQHMVTGIPRSELLTPTGISEERFLKAAALIFDNTPGWIRTGSGLELQPTGVQTVRAIAALLTILDPEAITAPMTATLAPLPGHELYPPVVDPVGKADLPLFYQYLGQGQGMHLPQAILHDTPYPVRAMVVVGGNPLATFPNTTLYKEAFARLDFLAVFDLFMTATARRADLVFPAATYLENLELIDYGRNGHPHLGLIRPVVDSTSGWPTWRFLFRLAEALGLEGLFPWQDNTEALRSRLASGTVTFDELLASPTATVPYQPQERKPGSWHTTDRKIHYFSQAVAATGNPPLPSPDCFQLPYKRDHDYPFWLSTGDRVDGYQHSQFRQSPSCKASFPEPVLEIHPEAADQMAIREGDQVRLSTREGHLEVSVHLTSHLRLDSLRLTHGWEEADANRLTSVTHLDPLSGFPWMRALPAQVEKIGNR